MRVGHVLFWPLCFLGLSAAANASVMYGSTSAGGAGELWTIDSTTGTAIHDVGPLDDSSATNYAVTGLAFNPLNGVLYGSTGNVSGHKLLTINPATGLVTIVGSFTVASGTMADIAFDSTGHLYGVSSSGGANLYSIDINTGASTEVGPSGVSFTEGGGLAISPADVFYSSPIHTDFGTFDPSTGLYTNITNPNKPGGSGTSYGSLAFDGNTLYGMDLSSPTHLVTIDSAGNVTDIGTSVGSIDGIAFPVPEPASATVLLAGAALTLTRRARRS